MASDRHREYETIAILRPDLLDDDVEQTKGKTIQVLDREQGRLIRFDNWGKRKLAYEVKKHAKGIYLYFLYLGTAGIVEELERNLKMWDDVIRFMTVKVDDDVDPDARPSEIEDEELERAALAATEAAEAEAEAETEAEAEGETTTDEETADDAGEEG